jgi:hypothetical protein
MEQRIYIQKNYSNIADNIFIFQSWRPTNSFYKFSFPYKKKVYENPYTYNISLEIQNENVDNVIISELLILLPNQNINLLNENITINYGGNVFNHEQIVNFKNTGIIGVSSIDDTQDKSISLMFHNINIPFEKIDSFRVKMTISVCEKSNIILIKEIFSEFEKIIIIKRIFPSV